MMQFYSTNRNIQSKSITGFKDTVSFSEALFMGIAPDGGLFMPTEIPHISNEEIQAMQNEDYYKTAFIIINKFLKDVFSKDELLSIVKESYSYNIPIEKIDSNNINASLVRLDQGPTASFKDYAARFMARAMQKLKPPDKKITILVATSGDTGSAVGEAFYGLENFNVFILYPNKEISILQKQQMDNIGKNVTTLPIEGKFDDCQQLVKRAFIDPELKYLNLTSANSINIGRILPQVVYYFYAFAQLIGDWTKDVSIEKNCFKEVVFAIPSGNFGNSLGCEIARRMGLPVKRIILAVNENDVFPKYLTNGIYKKIIPSKYCISNAMNVGNPSNLARYFDLYGGTIDKEGKIHKEPNINSMRENLFSVSITDEETIDTIKNIYFEDQTVLEPHGAVGIAALKKYRIETKDNSPAICYETAHPWKFPEKIEDLLKIKLKAPDSIVIRNKKRNQPKVLPHNYNNFKEILIKGE